MEKIALYLHVPFCKKKCPYCGFYSIAHGFEEKTYLNAIKKEVLFIKEHISELIPSYQITTFYAGGGTPSLLSPSFYEDLFNTLTQELNFQPVELTLEANPESITPEKLRALKNIGFTRISLGVQSFSKRGLKFLGRIHSLKRAIEAVEWIIETEFPSFSIDLIFDWKGQGEKTLKKELEMALSFKPPHLSLYEFTLEEGTPMWRDYQKKSWSSERKVERLCKIIEETLEKAGYERYEISNYALKGHRCLHNLFYWEVKPYLGLGPAAVSRLGKYRWKNPENYYHYCNSLLKEKRLPLKIVEEWDNREWAKEYIFMGLRLKEGIKIKFLEKRGYYFSHNTLKLLEKHKLIQQKGGRVFLTFKGRLLHNKIAAFLWENLEEKKQ